MGRQSSFPTGGGGWRTLLLACCWWQHKAAAAAVAPATNRLLGRHPVADEARQQASSADLSLMVDAPASLRGSGSDAVSWKAAPTLAPTQEISPTVADGPASLRSGNVVSMKVTRVPFEKNPSTVGGAALLRRSTRAGFAECQELQKGLVVQPAPTCWNLTLPGDWTGCTCSIRLPRSIRQRPDLHYDPYFVAPPKHENLPTFPPLKLPEPPRNPLVPYEVPEMSPDCPFKARCEGDSFECVGFNSWGFEEVKMAEYQPALAYLNEMICHYVMNPNSSFQVPPKVQELWKMQEQ